MAQERGSSFRHPSATVKWTWQMVVGVSLKVAVIGGDEAIGTGDSSVTGGRMKGVCRCCECCTREGRSRLLVLLRYEAGLRGLEDSDRSG